MAAGTSSYDDSFNPFSDDKDDDSLPDFSSSRVVLDNPSKKRGTIFDMTEFPIFDEGPSFRQMMETTYPDADETALDAVVTVPVAPPRQIRTSAQSTASSVAHETTPVIVQPRRDDFLSRRNIPVYTVGWSSTSNPQMIPANGLDFLTGVHEVLLQQTVTNLSTPNRSAKRYTIKVPNGETLYSTSENPTECGLLCCGSQRGFNMSVLDATQQEAAVFSRSTGCIFGWCPCLLQVLRIYAPGSMYLGAIHQDLSFAHISFTIRDSANEDLYRVFGPNDCASSIALDATFTLCGGRGGGRLGVIARRWNNSMGDYALHVSFPASGTQDEHKMLIIGAAMLIEYMFFEHRSTSMIRLC